MSERPSLETLMAQLQERGVVLRLDGDALKFNAPKGALTEDLKGQIKSRRSEVIAWLKNRDAVQRVDRSRAYPLSPGQKRLWFMEQMEGSRGLYVLPTLLRLNGDLDREALQGALDSLVARNGAFRTVYEEDAEGRPVQREVAAQPVALAVTPCHAEGLEDRRAEAAAAAKALCDQPFDLTSGLLLRAGLWQVSETEHVLGLVVHHIASDGWSLGLMVRDLVAAYRQGGVLPAEPDRIDYLDVVSAQQALPQEALAHWVDSLTGAPAVIDLPTDRPRPNKESYAGRRLPLALQSDMAEAVGSLARACGASPFMVLLAGFATALHRHGAPDDMVIGTPVAGRTAPGSEEVVGFFVNSLPLRLDLSGNPSFQDLVARVRKVCLTGFNHQSVPFEKMVDALKPERSLSHGPLFQVMFTLLNTPQTQLDWPGLTITPLPMETGTSQYDMSLSLEPDATGGYGGHLEYGTALFDQSSMEAFLARWMRLLQGAAADPTLSLWQLPFASEQEQVAALGSLTRAPGGGAVPDGFDSLKALFEAQVAQRPSALAVIVGEGDAGDLTYAELDGWANRLARRLQEAGAGPERCVALLADRSAAFIAAMLAVHKCGAAMVPLDPAWPDGRMETVLEDSGAPLMLCAPPLWERGRLIGASSGTTLLMADGADGVSAEPLPDPVDPGSLAYVLYTSGSTGRPKGVAVEHGMIAKHIRVMAAFYEMTPDDVFLHAAAPAFDLTQEQVWTALISGAAVAPLAKDAWTPDEILARCEGAGVSVMNLPPALWLPVSGSWAEEPSDRISALRLRLVVVGSDVMPPAGIRAWRALPLQTRLLNCYGPTEIVVTATTFDIPADYAEDGPVPIGPPIPGHRCVILDPMGTPVPPGVPGELWVSGPILGRGYFQRPDLTEAVFAPDPFAETAQGDCGRAYRTGDRVRQRTDGTFEFMGRLDRQLKLRGYRIEPGEIEAVLATNATVAEAIVGIRDNRLLAWVRADAGADVVSVEDLKTALRAHLPDYMVPSAFVILERFPLLPSGKVNRAALPDPMEAGTGARAQAVVVPRSETERQLHGIWARLLGLEADSFGIEHNFFELGGDSIIGIQMVSHARKAGLGLDARMIFRQQTVAALATVATRLDDAAAERLASLQTPHVGAVALGPAQRQFLAANPPNPDHHNQSVLLTLPKDTDTAALALALGDLCAQHDMLRARLWIEDSNGDWQQETAAVLPSDQFDLPVRAYADLPMVCAEMQAGLDLASGRVFRACRLTTDDDATVDRLVLVAHHLVVDGVSWRILLEDLASALKSRARDVQAQPDLPLRTLSYAAWVAAQSKTSDAETPSGLQGVAAAQVPQARALPGCTGGPGLEGDTIAHAIALDAAASAALIGPVHRAYGTRTDDVLLSALLMAVGTLTGMRAIDVMLEGHGRGGADAASTAGMDIDRTVGWFTAFRPLALRASADGDLGAIVKTVKESLRHPVVAGGHPEMSFNYLGRLEESRLVPAPFGLAEEDTGPSRAADNPRPYRLEIDCWIGSAGQLEARFAFDPTALATETVHQLAKAFQNALTRLSGLAETGRRLGYSPSDFPQSGLDQAALDRLFAPKGAQVPAIEDVFPLSPMQDGMLFHGRMVDPASAQPAHSMWFEQTIATLEGAFDEDAFAEAWTGLHRRHGAFRTRYVSDGLPRTLQVVEEEATPDFQVLDWSGEADPSGRLAAYLIEDKARGFDIATAPLTRMRIIRIGPQERRLIWSIHHSIFDGWCQSLVLRDLVTLYQAALDGTLDSVSLPKPGRFADHVAWLAGRDVRADEAFWRAELAGFDTPSRLSLGRPERADSHADDGVAAKRDYRECRDALDADLTARLEHFARTNRVTLNTIIQGIIGLMLHRLTGMRDICFGTAIAGRPPERAEAEETVGLFINSLPARMRIPHGVSLVDWLADLQGAHQAREAHGHAALVDIRRWSDLPHGTAPYDVLLAFENYPTETALEGRQTPFRPESVDVAVEEVNDPVSIQVVPGQRIAVKISYDAGLYEDAAITGLMTHIHQLAEAFLAAPDAALEAIALLPEAAAEQAVIEPNRTILPYQPDLPLQRRITEQALARPDAPAVVCGGELLSYAALRQEADRLAWQIQSLGIGMNERVAVFVDRSASLPLALVGVLISGAAYVPLDPIYPPERIAMMLEDDGGVRAIVTRRCDADQLPPTSAPILFIEDVSDWPDPPEGALAADPRPEALAYVIYTSGSTGRPKGVAVPHRALNNFCATMLASPGLSATDIICAVTTASFDISVLELLVSLVAGAKIVVAPREVVADGAALAALAEACDATILQATPATWRMLAETGWAGKADMAAWTGGEALTRDLGRWMLEHCREAWNLYGPTETTVYSAIIKIGPGTRANLSEESPESIGWPVGNTALYILDEAFRPLPDGVPGALFIGGHGVTLGYLARPDLTAEKFLPDPFAASATVSGADGVRYLRAGARMYDTGDIARRLPDGRIEYLGRRDHQVKIRGFRIELGEIESVLAAHAAVARAVVIAHGSGADAKLVAYVVPDAEGAARISAREADVETDPEDTVASSDGDDGNRWQGVWDRTYGTEAEDAPAAGDGAAMAEEADFDLRGWMDSRSGAAIPHNQMSEWVETTCDRIRAHLPQGRSGQGRVLEIGCGTGLLMFRVAPDTACYVGTDFSGPVLAQGQVRLNAKPDLQDVIHLHHCTADQVALPDSAGSEPVDLVVINSVAQYFPDPAYLEAVLARAVDLVADGGSIFLGDIRSRALLDAYHLFRLSGRLPGDTGLSDLAAAVRRGVRDEEELVMDAAWFHGLAASGRIPRLAAVETAIKPGGASNEMTRYRVDITLRVGPPRQRLAGAGVVDRAWETVSPAAAPDDSLAAVQACVQAAFADASRSAVILRDLPNGRLRADREAMTRLTDDQDAVLADLVDLASFHALPEAKDPLHPDRIAAWAEGQGWALEMAPAASGDAFAMDLVVSRGAGDEARALLALYPEDAPSAEAVRAAIHDPSRRALEAGLAPVLRAHAAEALPDYMVPSVVMTLPALPLTPNGKVDRKALPEPDAEEGLSVGSDAPRGPMEEIISGLFADVLGLPRVGIHDDFFLLGGHSLLATRLVTRLRTVLGHDIPLRTLFEQPTTAKLAAQVSGLLAAGENAAAGDSAIPARAHGDAPAPLSFSQARLWFLDRLEPGSVGYLMPGAFDLDGPLDVPALSAALAAVVARHGVLRACFPERADGTPEMRIAPADGFDLPLPVTDLTDLPDAAREAAADQATREETLIPFDLATGPVLRWRLLRLGPARHRLLITMHHIVSDGWSIGVMGREIAAVYGAHRAGTADALALPDLPISYGDYAVWQQTALSEARIAGLVAERRAALAHCPPHLDLPTDQPRQPGTAFAAGRIPLRLDRRMTDAVHRFAQTIGATPFMVVTAAWAALLARISGQEHVAVGTPVAGRVREELDGLVGFFVNTLVLPCDMSGLTHTGAQTLVERVRAAALAAYGTQELPFEQVVDHLAPERDPVRPPLFQTMVVYQNTPDQAVTLDDLTIRTVAAPPTVAKFDLVLLLEEVAEAGDDAGSTGADVDAGLIGHVEYNADLYGSAFSAGLATAWMRLLETMILDPQRPVFTMDLVADPVAVAEPPEAAAPRTGPFASLWGVLERAAEDPERACRPGILSTQAGAVTATLSLGDWHQEARHIAAGVVEQLGGRTAGVPVGLHLGRTPERLQALLALWRIGAIAVPLDPEQPSDRLTFIAKDAGCALILGPSLGSAGTAPAIPALAVEAVKGYGTPQTVLPPEPGAEDPAYVVYTSGSTGVPKGVLVPHRALVSIGRAQADPMGLGTQTEDRLLMMTAVGFDVAMGDLAAALVGGAALVLAGRDDLLPGPGLMATLTGAAVTHAQAAASLWAALPAEPPLPETLRCIVSGGEALAPALAARLTGPTGQRRVINAYGPTEATVVCAMAECGQTALALVNGEGDIRSRLPFGQAFEGVRFSICDAAGRPVPDGAVGELYIGGIGVALGYVGRPDLTAAAFVPDPDGAPGARRYRTGDLVRRRAEGAVEFIGRRDGQVKLRGVRIELEEIERGLAALPGVAGACTDIRDLTGGAALVAWIVPEPGTETPLTATAMRAGLRGHLPEAMIPSRLGVIDRLPLTANGKLDRSVPATPDAVVAGDADGGVLPETPWQKRIAGIWQELLGIETIPISANFFELGGHSLLATRVQARLREQVGLELPVADLFDHPTVDSLAAHCQQKAGVVAGDGAGVADVGSASEPSGTADSGPIKRTARRRRKG